MIFWVQLKIPGSIYSMPPSTGDQVSGQHWVGVLEKMDLETREAFHSAALLYA